jgi:hypothetical protein
LLVTDGQETTSKASLAQAVHAARVAHVLVYPVAIESSAFSPGPLRELAGKTGGAYYGAASSAELTHIYSRIARELRRTWSLEYFTSARAGDHIRLRVTVPRLGGASYKARLAGTTSTARVSSGAGLGLLLAVAFASLVLVLVALPVVGAARSRVRLGGSDF